MEDKLYVSRCENPVSVSFGMRSLSKPWSFPQKRESSSTSGYFQWLAFPAFAGMTAPGSTRASPMTPLRKNPTSFGRSWPSGRCWLAHELLPIYVGPSQRRKLLSANVFRVWETRSLGITAQRQGGQRGENGGFTDS